MSATAKVNRQQRERRVKVALDLAKGHPSFDPVLDASEAANYAGRCVETIRRAVRLRELAAVRAPGRSSHIRVRLSALNAWLKRMETPASRRHSMTQA